MNFRQAVLDWLSKRWMRWTTDLLCAFAVGLISGLGNIAFFGPTNNLPSRFVTGISIGIGIILTLRLIGRLTYIEPTDKILWNWRNIITRPNWKNALTYGLVCILVVSIVFGLTFGFLFGIGGEIRGGIGALLIDNINSSSHSGLFPGLIFGSILGIAFGLFFSLLSIIVFLLGGSLQSQIIDNRTQPNAGILNSISNASTGGAIFGLSGALVFGLIFGSSNGLVYKLVFNFLKWLMNILAKVFWQYGYAVNYGMVHRPINTLLSGLAGGLLCLLLGMFQYGGYTVIRHYTLRLLLWLSGAFPWNITAFLDSCAQRRLVQRVGGGWRFPHNLIRDYFAELEINQESIAEAQKL